MNQAEVWFASMNLGLFGVALIVIGLVTATNLWGIADRAARFNARSGGLPVNSHPASWRVSGVIAVAVGLPLAIWFMTHP